MKHLANDPKPDALENWALHRMQVLEPVPEFPVEHNDEILVSSLDILSAQQFLDACEKDIRICTAGGLETRRYVGCGDDQWRVVQEFVPAVQAWAQGGGAAAVGGESVADLKQQLAEAHSRLVGAQAAISAAQEAARQAAVPQGPLDAAKLVYDLAEELRASPALAFAWHAQIAAAARAEKAPDNLAGNVARRFMDSVFGFHCGADGEIVAPGTEASLPVTHAVAPPVTHYAEDGLIGVQLIEPGEPPLSPIQDGSDNSSPAAGAVSAGSEPAPSTNQPGDSAKSTTSPTATVVPKGSDAAPGHVDIENIESGDHSADASNMIGEQVSTTPKADPPKAKAKRKAGKDAKAKKPAAA